MCKIYAKNNVNSAMAVMQVKRALRCVAVQSHIHSLIMSQSFAEKDRNEKKGKIAFFERCVTYKLHLLTNW